MENSITFTPKYKVGDTVYAVLWASEAEENFYQNRTIHDNKLQIYLKKIVAVRYFQSEKTSTIDYFLEGLFSYEGENWFDENPVSEYEDQGIFETEEEAKEHIRKYNEIYHLDDEENIDIND